MESNLQELTEKTKILVVGVHEHPDKVASLLREIGFSGDIIEAPDENEGYDLFKSQNDPFGFVICGIDVKTEEGMSFVKVMANDGKLSAIPVFILLDEVNESIIDKSFDLGVAGYVLKCESHTSLLLKINEGWSKFYHKNPGGE